MEFWFGNGTRSDRSGLLVRLGDQILNKVDKFTFGVQRYRVGEVQISDTRGDRTDQLERLRNGNQTQNIQEGVLDRDGIEW